ncbi:MAG TPA: ABC transporter ATPase [Bacteroidia bacterium]|jgi:hypothetical protein|nr:ABC transporter ATPase [Bacteroidia bacterium]
MNTYEELVGESRVWVFQAERELSETEYEAITGELTQFVDNWISHGSLLKATFQLLHNRFIVFMVDEEGDRMCGRATDASVRLIKELEAKYHISMLDRNRMAFIDNKGEIQSCKLNELNYLIEEGKVTPQTKVFNNLVQNKNEFEKSWIVPMAESWQNSYIMQNH